MLKLMDGRSFLGVCVCLIKIAVETDFVHKLLAIYPFCRFLLVRQCDHLIDFTFVISGKRLGISPWIDLDHPLNAYT